ncbi:MAG: hypothetical protein H6750_10305 [Nitrospiraceae bacterium]|nr:hypothetical protein [Nitrospira sp.]MCB9774699.1 hypothetical protein [Nitrospiraceae bacterium]
MAEKFANARWVKEGFLDNRVVGSVIGQITFAGLGTVDVYLVGDFVGEIAGKVIGFRNPRFLDDPQAGESLYDFSVPQLGKVSLMSFDPHPLLEPHPYFEWFSAQQQHYRIELQPNEAWLMSEVERDAVEIQSQRIRKELAPLLP